MAITITVRSAEDLKKVRSRIRNSEAIGKIIARVLESQSQRAFLDQRLGEYVWPERYPNQEDPFVNTAALVNWTNSGGQVLRRFFDRRPALRGTGDLMQSITARAARGQIEVGSALPYAGLHQWGGTSTQPIEETAKKTIGKWIGEEKGPDGKWRKSKRMGPRQKEQRAKFWLKLAPLLGSTELSTEVVQRPFLGITPENDKDIAESIEHYVANGENE